jgi:diguanylate cyclase (GGDEF)-like protein
MWMWTSRTRAGARTPLGRARRDLLVGAVLIGAAVLLLASGFRVATDWLARAPGGDATRIAILLNIALILFGWRRYRDLVALAAERETADARVSALARTDELTGLATRRSFAEQGAGVVQAAVRRHRAAALLVLDLDHFKTINDLHGHLLGDQVLQEAAERVRRVLPASALAGRLDGDSFAVLTPFDPRHPGTVDALAGHLVGALAQPIAARGVTTHVGASIGIARTDCDCRQVEPLLRRATIAMRTAKAAGRSRYAWFDTAMDRELTERNAIEAGLRAGIPAGQFLPFYEQQVELDSGRLLGFEVLARWEHPNRGLLMPDLFVPVAEECGLIGDLSVAIMRRAFAEARDWDPSLTLSVNISPAQLKDPWLAQKIVKLLVETGFPANRLEIEITESALFENLALAQSIVGSLKNQGIRLALDDFGTGYSSLAHLRAMPFDRIKIDRSFVAAMAEDAESAAIVAAISSLGERLSLPVSAEGVETAAMLDQLTAIGCAKGQGWHFGKPMTIAATRRLLAERGLLPAARGPAERPDANRRSA